MQSLPAYPDIRSFLFWISIFPVLLLSAFTGNGQQYYARNFTIEDGLPSDIVRSVFTDSRKIMWIGTGAGLCRFNGREFIVYNKTDGLAAENIFDITEDNRGNLWMGAMGGGISKFDGKIFTNYSMKDGLVSNEVRRVWWSPKFSLLLVGTNKGFSAFDGKRFYSLGVSAIQSNMYTVLGFLELDNCIELYAYGSPRIFRYYPAIHKFTEVAAAGKYTGIPSCSPVTGMNGDTVWSWGRAGIRVCNKGIQSSFDSIGQVFHMAVDGEKNVWIAAWPDSPVTPRMPGGLYRYDGKKIERLDKKVGITDPSVWTVYYDPVYSCIWIGTLHQGLFRMPFPYFEWYTHAWFGLSVLNINDIHADRHDNLWIATSREIIRKNGDGSFIIYPNRQIKSAQYAAFKNAHPRLAAHQKDPDGSFVKYDELIATRKYPYPNPYRQILPDSSTDTAFPPGSLYDPVRYANTGLEMAKYANDTSAISFYGIEEDSRKNIFFSGGWGLNCFPEGSRLVIPEVIPIQNNAWVFAFDESDSLFMSSYWDKGIMHCAIYPGVMYPDRCYYHTKRDNAPANPVRMISRGDEIWCASRTGGLYLTRNGRNYAFSKSVAGLPTGINDICFDGRKNIIAGSNNGELFICRLDGDNLKVISRLNANDGIVGKSILWVQTDHEHNLYAGTNKGLNLVNLDQLYATGKAEVRFFSHETGYSDMNGKQAAVDSSGDIWVATDKSICRISHEIISKHKTHPMKLVLTGLEINNVTLSKIPGYVIGAWFGSPPEGLRLSHDQNNLDFYFDALNYLDAGQQRYRYRLLPAIPRWTDFSLQSRAVFTTLNPGSYRLEVESVNYADQSQVSRLSYNFMIKPPFYSTLWFILEVMILLTATGVLLWRWRTRQIRKQEKEKAALMLKLSQIEQNAVKARLNPHFMFNALNSIQSYILSNNVDKALYYLSMFSKFVRKTLENANKDFIPLAEELEYVNFYIGLEKMRFEGQFTCETDIDPLFPLDMATIPAMMLQPFVENAIKHGLLKRKGVGVLKLMVRKSGDDYFGVIIEDNGIGRKKAGELQKKVDNIVASGGLDTINTRIRLYNDNEDQGKLSYTITDLFDSSGNPAGTRVEVNFPF